MFTKAPLSKLKQSAASGPILKMLPVDKRQITITEIKVRPKALPMLPKPQPKKELSKMPKTGTKYTRLSLKQNIAVNDALREHCKSVDGLAVYNEGHDDDTIAALTLSDWGGEGGQAVGLIRRKLFGKFPPATPKTPTRSQSDLEARVIKLEAIVAKLCENLGVNQLELGL